jgi:hypothetical protein
MNQKNWRHSLEHGQELSHLKFLKKSFLLEKMSSSNSTTPVAPTNSPSKDDDNKQAQCQESRYFIRQRPQYYITQPQYYVFFDESSSHKNRSVIVSIIAFLWIITGVAAYFFSLACTGGSSFKHNLWGLIIASFLGPLYFIYFYYMREYGYCYGKKPALVA